MPSGPKKRRAAKNKKKHGKEPNISNESPSQEEVKCLEDSNEGDEETSSIPVIETVSVVDSSKKPITLSDEKTNSGTSSSADEYSNNSQASLSEVKISSTVENQDLLAFLVDPNDEVQKSVAENILDEEKTVKGSELNENEQVLESPIGSSDQPTKERAIQTSSAGMEHLLGTSQNNSESRSANFDQMLLACPLHCSFNQWVGSKSKMVSTNEEKNAMIVCDEHLECVKKTVEKEIQIADEIVVLLRKLLDELNAIQISKY